MNRSLSLRSAQALTTTTAPYLRATLLGALALLGSVGSAMAQDTSSVKAKQADAETLLLTVENPQHERMQVRVVALDHNLCLVNEVNHEASYGTKLGFKGVPAGKYAVTLRVGREQYRYNVQVQSQPQTTISVQGLTPATAPAVVASATR